MGSVELNNEATVTTRRGKMIFKRCVTDGMFYCERKDKTYLLVCDNMAEGIWIGIIQDNAVLTCERLLGAIYLQTSKGRFYFDGGG